MSDNLQKIQIIDQRSKYLVFGFIGINECLLQLNTSYYIIVPSIKNIILLYFCNALKSSILTSSEENKLIELFNKHNKFKELNNFSYNLIYKGSKDGFNQKYFIKKCHNKKNILCLIKTNDDDVYGGYTSIGWKENSPKSIEYDKDEKAFIFLVISSKKYKIMLSNIKYGHENKAIRWQRNYFCMFGWGPIIYIADKKTDTMHNVYWVDSYESFPHDGYFHGGKSSFRGKYTVTEFEIFELK